MLWFSFVMALLATLCYAIRTGQVFTSITLWERIARFGVGITLVSLVVAILRRALAGEPVLWTSYPITISLIVTVVGYLGLFASEYWTHRHYRLCLQDDHPAG